MKKKLAVFFPGRRYGVDCPLLYYAEKICRNHGYETILLHYSEYRDVKDMVSISENIKQVKKYLEQRLAQVCWEEYERIVFVSKSIGTVLAGYTEQKNHLHVHHIYLTPLAETFPYMKKENTMVIAGTEDPYLPAAKLQQFCKENGIEVRWIQGVRHSLEEESVRKTLLYLEQIMEWIEEFMVVLSDRSVL